jgi:uncharacterized Zn finger protein
MVKQRAKSRAGAPTEAELRALAGDSYFARGEAYFRSGAVRSLSVSAGGVEAAAQGIRVMAAAAIR